MEIMILMCSNTFYLSNAWDLDETSANKTSVWVIYLSDMTYPKAVLTQIIFKNKKNYSLVLKCLDLEFQV